MRLLSTAGLLTTISRLRPPVSTAALMVVSLGLFNAVRVHAADLAVGKEIFTKCRICHAVDAGAPSTVGPNLHGVFARKAGSLPGFSYSPAMKASTIVWDDDTLAKFLSNPQAFIPGNRMAFPGIKDKAQLADLIAYLKQATK
jgi:cytochrome c